MRAMPSMCDENSLMSIPAILDMFQDIAGIHAESVGIGALELEEHGLFWIVSKLRLRISRRPQVQETFDATTWIQPAERVSCERDWALSKDGEQLAYVRSIWAALRRDNFRPGHMSDFYPDSDFSIAPPDDMPFTRMGKNFEGAEFIGEYRIRSVDIDRGGHMNNVNYVRAMLGCFTLEELNAMSLSEMDIHFVRQCYEGDTIRFVKRPSEDMLMEIAAINEEGTVVFMAAVK
jgi:acyl-ACP thioesterase